MLTILFVLILTSDIAVLYRNGAFSILVPSTFQFFEKGFRFPENLF